MPGLRGNPPAIRTPGAGPNGPAPVDARIPVASVGTGSVPYGPTNGYASPNGVPGFVGPAASSLRQPTAWYVRVGGNNLNGGSSTSLTADRSGSDGVTTNGSFSFSSASAAFTTDDVGEGMRVGTGTSTGGYCKILSVQSATQCTVSIGLGSSASGVSWAIGGAWADPTPVLGSNVNARGTCGVQTGDTVYIGAGTYRVVYLTGSNFGAIWGGSGIQTTPLSAQAGYFNGVVNIIGDVTGQFTGDPGMVQLTAYTTNDKTAAVASAVLGMNSKSNFVFRNLMFVGGATTGQAASCVEANVGGLNVSFIDCMFDRGSNAGNSAMLIRFGAAFGFNHNWLFDRCIFVSRGTGQQGAMIWMASAAFQSDYFMNFLIQNSTFIGGNSSGTQGAISFMAAGAGPAGCGIVRNCTFFASSITVFVAGGSTKYPNQVYNCLFLRDTDSALNATTLGQLIENYNLIDSLTPRTNVTAGANSISNGSYATLAHFGQERIWGGLLRRFTEPMVGSPLLGFGNDGGQTLYDLANGPRPSGGASPLPAVGALERSNTSAQATSPAPTSGTHVWQFTGPAYQDFLLPVSAVASGFSIQVQRDANYAVWPGGSNSLPAVLLLANPTIGVSAQTVVDTGVDSQWNTLTLSNFTPTGTGWVTVRIASYDGSGSSVVSFSVATPS